MQQVGDIPSNPLTLRKESGSLKYSFSYILSQ